MNNENDLDETLKSLRNNDIPEEIFRNTTNNSSKSVHDYLSKYKENLAKPYQQTKEEELAHRRLEETLRDYKETNTLRQKYAKNIYRLTYIWLIFIGFIVLLTGIGNLHIKIEWLSLDFTLFEFNLSDNVLIAFITTTTINVIGIIYIVARWLFPNGIEVFKEKNENE